MIETATKEDVVRRVQTARTGPSLFIRIAITAVALIIWFWSQRLIGAHGAPDQVIVDRVHAFTAPQTSICTRTLQRQIFC